MKTVRTKQELADSLDGLSGIGFVPTMGALHEGHASLLRAAKSDHGTCVLSIFVNPTQFRPGEDFESYPRTESADLALAHENGVDIVYLPSVEEIYGERPVTTVSVEGPAVPFEGRFRPGHFAGVCTVVLKLFNQVKPMCAYFGLKDLQQCSVLSAMVHDLDVPVELRFVPTVRACCGLALSSRNAYLGPHEKTEAAKLYAGICNCRALIAQGENVDTSLHVCKVQLENNGFTIDYLAYVEPVSMLPLDTFEPSGRVIVAATYGSVRLIDNVGDDSLAFL